MFYYLSFLRPPPQAAQISGYITITPQLANDLRTELLDDPFDIFYSWSLVQNSSTVAGTSSFPAISKPRKLTTWRQGSAYKELQVPLPPGLRDGQSYRLVLTVHDQGFPHVINLAGPSCGARPFPVLSMPILFSSRARADAGKQERIERIYRVPTAPEGQVFLKVTEQTSFDLDKKIWDSGIGLSSWITDLSTGALNEPVLSDLKRRLLDAASVDILELGAGTGIVALAIGALRSCSSSSSSNQRGCILTTDLLSAIPLLEHNVLENGKFFSQDNTKPRPLVLDWDNKDLPPEILAVRGGFDVIIMADVTYNTASFPSLVRTLKSIIALHDSSDKPEPPLVLLGYKERDSAERTLWDMAREIGVDFLQVGERAGMGGQPIEIWLGHVHESFKQNATS